MFYLLTYLLSYSLMGEYHRRAVVNGECQNSNPCRIETP